MINLYKPNKKNTGAALSFDAANAQTKDRKMLAHSNGSVYVTMAKQSGWDDQKRIGYFRDSYKDDSKNVRVILGDHEIAEILQCFRDKRAVNDVQIDYTDRDSVLESSKKATFFHRSKAGDKVIKLYPAKKNCSDGSFVFGVSDITNKIHIGIILTSNEARMIEEALTALLQKYYSSQIDSSLAYSVKNQGNKNSQKSTPKKEESSDEDEFAEDDPESGSELEDDEDVPF